MNLGLHVGRAVLALGAAIVVIGWTAIPASAASFGASGLSPSEQQNLGVKAVRTNEHGSISALIPTGGTQEVELTVKTTPPLPGVRLSLDGTTVTTDQAGVASFSQQRGSQGHTLTLLDTGIETSDTRYSFSRWVGQRDPDQAFSPNLDGLSLRTDSALTAAFSAQHAVTPRFVDQDGKTIDPAQISSATARSDTGAVITISATGPTWLDGTRIAYRGNALELQASTYTWQTVIVSGTNVIDAGNQSFTPSTTTDVTVVGQFHDLTIAGYDALLSHGTGNEAVLTYPDGTTRTAPLNAESSATFQHLPRGTYQAKITAASSIVSDHQVRLSRDITLRVPVISSVDLSILVGVLMVLAVGLVLVGRKGVRRRLLAPLRRIVPQRIEAK